MTVDQLLERAVLMVGTDSYSRHADGLVGNLSTSVFSATGFLERANCLMSTTGMGYLRRGNPTVLAEAKARVCKKVGAPHIDHWEATERPNWSDVQAAFSSA